MGHGMLDTIAGPADLKTLDGEELTGLCGEIRQVLVSYGKEHGGHIGSNLGVVEMTVALHRVFDSPRDRLIFDVSHQSYVHKMLTGRSDSFRNPSAFNAVTGFTNPKESEHDQFVLGHTGTSISLACGLAKARDMSKNPDGQGSIRNVIAIIGDGALSSGVAWEGLDNAGVQAGNLIIILNDNEMSITENHGSLYTTLDHLRQSGGDCADNPFKAFGLEYRYEGLGNDVNRLVDLFASVKDINHPVLIHIHTCKGLGLDAEDAGVGMRPGKCEANHWQNPIKAMASAQHQPDSRMHYGSAAMQQLSSRFESQPGLVVISPATPGSNGITPVFRTQAGEHYVDTGITEEHATAFAAGIAKAGGRPVLATSATFFQRAYDEIQQELALNHVPATLLVFAAGISSSDNTHSGAEDIAMLGNMPNLTCLAPIGEEDFLDMLAWASGPSEHGAVAIRVPGDAILSHERTDPLYLACSTAQAGWLGGERRAQLGPADTNNPYNFYRLMHRGAGVAIIALGNAYPLGVEVARELAADKEEPLDATLVDPRQYSTLDRNCLNCLAESHRLVVTIEDGQLEGGWGEKIGAYYANRQTAGKTAHSGASVALHVLNVGGAKELSDRVPMHRLYERYGMTVGSITARIRTALAD